MRGALHYEPAALVVADCYTGRDWFGRAPLHLLSWGSAGGGPIISKALPYYYKGWQERWWWWAAPIIVLSQVGVVTTAADTSNHSTAGPSYLARANPVLYIAIRAFLPEGWEGIIGFPSPKPHIGTGLPPPDTLG